MALATCGTGVTVNSTHHSPGQELAAHRWYWPLHYDAGFKWARVGYHDDPINWHWVEKEKGVLKIDPVTDAAVTELAAHGVNIVMSLNFGNRLYSGPATRPIPQLWEWNYDMPAPPTTPDALAAWTRYVEFMVKHFRDRVDHFEIWNEWNISCYWGAVPNVEHYLAVARAAIPVIRQHAPDAKIMMGSWAGFPHGISTWSPEQLAAKEKESLILQATRELAREVDEIGWHPCYQADPERWKNYGADVRALRAWLETVGFRGHCMATEWNYSALYPPLSDAEAIQGVVRRVQGHRNRKGQVRGAGLHSSHRSGDRVILLRDVLSAIWRSRPESLAAILRRRSHFAAPTASRLLRHAEPRHDARRTGARRVRVHDRSGAEQSGGIRAEIARRSGPCALAGRPCSRPL